MLTLINKNYRSTPCSQNIVQILSLFLKNSSIFPSNNFWIFRPKYSNIRIIFGFWKCPRIEYEYQYSEENIRIFEYIRIFVSTLIWIILIWLYFFRFWMIVCTFFSFWQHYNLLFHYNFFPFVLLVLCWYSFLLFIVSISPSHQNK